MLLETTRNLSLIVLWLPYRAHCTSKNIGCQKRRDVI
uniref:Uncharacterized protein n=1 Tax=Anguilla anguilla TaxID=7936 RepID=A0A0E9WBL9_ANGAN